jgi:predicted signal transduction protein with EAL and GGDEF domain
MAILVTATHVCPRSSTPTAVTAALLRSEGREVQVGASIGIALDSTGRELIESVVQDADFALYRAKHNGRGRVELAAPSVSRVPYRSLNGSTG